MASNSNPFGQEQNPFADPAIQSATQNVQITQRALDEYNPFAEKNFQTKPAAIIPTTTNAASSSSSFSNTQTYQPTPTPAAVPPPTYTQQTAQKLNLSDIEKQQDELNRRAAELERREQLLQPQSTANNFPPLPSWCPGPLKPCFYQDISREIPVEFQKWVRVLFYLWIFHIFTLGFNIIAALVVFITLGNGVTFGYSILYFVLFSPLSYICWFRPAYKGFRADSSVNFMIFFIIFFLQIVVNILECIGFVDSGFCGILLLVSVLATRGVNNIVSGIFVLLATICFIGVACADILVLIKVHRLYRTTGASFEKAQAEFATNVMSNKNVQNAATTVVTEGARAAMSSQQQTYGSSTGKF